MRKVSKYRVDWVLSCSQRWTTYHHHHAQWYRIATSDSPPCARCRVTDPASRECVARGCICRGRHCCRYLSSEGGRILTSMVSLYYLILSDQLAVLESRQRGNVQRSIEVTMRQYRQTCLNQKIPKTTSTAGDNVRTYEIYMLIQWIKPSSCRRPRWDAGVALSSPDFYSTRPTGSRPSSL